jgi:hypothetical protein
MRQAARGFIGMGDMRSAAIRLTNAAVALLEKSELSDSEMVQVKRFIDFGFEHKQPDTVDWGYSEATLGMYYSDLRTDSRSDRISNLQRSNEAHERALEIFARLNEVVSISAHTLVAKVAKELYREQRAQKTADVFLEHVTELPAAAQVWAADLPNMMAQGIMTNPAIYGFAAAPDWLSESVDAPPSPEDAAMLQAASNLITLRS